MANYKLSEVEELVYSNLGLTAENLLIKQQGLQFQLTQLNGPITDCNKRTKDFIDSLRPKFKVGESEVFNWELKKFVEEKKEFPKEVKCQL